jgi:hypothetical protein
MVACYLPVHTHPAHSGRYPACTSLSVYSHPAPVPVFWLQPSADHWERCSCLFTLLSGLLSFSELVLFFLKKCLSLQLWTFSTYGLLILSWVSNGPLFIWCVCVCWSQGLMNAKHTLYHWATPLVVPTFHFFWLSSPWTQRHSVITFFKGYASCVSKCIRQKLSPLPTDTLCDRSLFPGFPFSKSPLLNWYYLWVTP